MKNILIVEDEEPSGRLLQQILEKAGFRSTLAFNARDARKFFAEKPYDLVISDIVMPGESGLDLMHFILSEKPDTAAIMITGLDDTDVANSALDIGVYDYIIKPFSKSEVLIAFTNAMRRRKQNMEHQKQKQKLEQVVIDRTSDLKKSIQKFHKSLQGTIQAIALTAQGDEQKRPFPSLIL